MMAEGATSDPYVLTVPDVPLPPLPPDLEYRVRYTFPYQGRDLLDTLVFVAPKSLPIGVPVGALPFVVSRFITRVDHIRISDGAAYQIRGLTGGLVLIGEVVEVLNPSPFGPLEGLQSAIGTGFIEGATATFKLLGGTNAGDHATFVPSATGYLHIGRPWQSFH
jgi:hypothetical protein